MEIETKALGTVIIDEKQIITLPEGFYGFEGYHRFALLDAEQKPFLWIQSLEDVQLAFIALDPFIFRPDYEINIDDTELQPLQITSPSDVVVLALVTIPTDGSPITANLQGPLIINKKNQQGMQLILDGKNWKTKHDIIAEMNGGKSPC